MHETPDPATLAGEAPALPVATPEAPYAGFGRRLAAHVLDMACSVLLATLVCVPLMVVFWAGVAFVAAGPMEDGGDLRGEHAILVFALVLAGSALIITFIVVLVALYFVLFTGWRGQTPGKWLLGIRVVDLEGSPPGFRRAFMREVVGKFLSSSPLYLGFLWPLWDPQHRAWHDKIAGTFVVRVGRLDAIHSE